MKKLLAYFLVAPLLLAWLAGPETAHAAASKNYSSFQSAVSKAKSKQIAAKKVLAGLKSQLSALKKVKKTPSVKKQITKLQGKISTENNKVAAAAGAVLTAQRALANCLHPGDGQFALFVPGLEDGEQIFSYATQNNCPIDEFSVGHDVVPAIDWTINLPFGSKTYAIIMKDTGSGFYFLGMYIPSDVHELMEGSQPGADGGLNATWLMNDYGSVGYEGPCPPVGQHHIYIYTVYALNGPLNLGAITTAAALDAALQHGGAFASKVLGAATIHTFLQRTS